MTETIDAGGTVSAKLQPPNGIDQIVATFGNIENYIQSDGTLDPRWQIDTLDYIALPVPLMLSYDHPKTITHFRCHKLLVERLEAVFIEIKSKGLEPDLYSFGGCFSFRPQRTGSKLSAHSWGIAIDLNSESNRQGTAGDMNPGIISVFRNAGFEWGGDWPGRTRDPMHFQFCTGY
jgi:D-alanyl-D-alanine carboxypeptidase